MTLWPRAASSTGREPTWRVQGRGRWSERRQRRVAVVQVFWKAGICRPLCWRSDTRVWTRKRGFRLPVGRSACRSGQQGVRAPVRPQSGRRVP